jgi:hypothetical protein
MKYREKNIIQRGWWWMSMEYWWNDTDRGNWSTGRKNIVQVLWQINGWIQSIGWMIQTEKTEVPVEKTLYNVGGRWMEEYGTLVEWCWHGKLKYWEKKYSVGGRWMNEYGALVEWYWQWKPEVLGDKISSVSHLPLQITYGLAQNRTPVSAITGLPQSEPY